MRASGACPTTVTVGPPRQVGASPGAGSAEHGRTVTGDDGSLTVLHSACVALSVAPTAGIGFKRKTCPPPAQAWPAMVAAPSLTATVAPLVMPQTSAYLPPSY